MKQDNIDEKLKALLKTQETTDTNEWFTRKVLNRLPPKSRHDYAWINIAVYIICLVICLAGWVAFIFSLTPGILLVRDLLSGIALMAATAALLWQALGYLLHMAES